MRPEMSWPTGFTSFSSRPRGREAPGAIWSGWQSSGRIVGLARRGSGNRDTPPGFLGRVVSPRRAFTEESACVFATRLSVPCRRLGPDPRRRGPSQVALAGATAGAFVLQIPPGARAEATGRFYQSVADDAFGPWWNPAGLAFTRGVNAGLMHSRLAEGLAVDDAVYFEYLGASTDIEGWGCVAGTISYLNYGESPLTDGSSNQFGTFSSFEIAPSVALGTTVLPNLGLGMNLKFVYVKLPERGGPEDIGAARSERRSGIELRRGLGRALPARAPGRQLLRQRPGDDDAGNRGHRSQPRAQHRAHRRQGVRSAAPQPEGWSVLRCEGAQLLLGAARVGWRRAWSFPLFPIR